MNVDSDVAVIGLGPMGASLALNLESRGFGVAVFNRTLGKVHELLAGRAAGKRIFGAGSLEELAGVLRRPRKVILMVKEGAAVDEYIGKLIPHLEPGDVIVDGGNSHPSETQRRTAIVESHDLLYIGMGVSGGEEGALKGPSLMPGGSEAAWPLVRPMLEAIAAKAGPSKDIPCVAWIGPGGAGHYVKMVHNGIEYGNMQLICEAYALLKQGLNLANPEIRRAFGAWIHAGCRSYLLEIARDILTVKDPCAEGFLLDMILDKAKAKGTGKWMAQLALDLGVPGNLVTEAVLARSLSAIKPARLRASRILRGPECTRYEGDPAELIEQLGQGFLAGTVLSCAQGFLHLRAAAAERRWNLCYAAIAAIWRGGCIIRADILEPVMKAFADDPDLDELILAPYFSRLLNERQNALRRVVTAGIQLGIPVPAFSAALAYYDGFRSEWLPANLLQAMRDDFGAHEYERIDRPGTFHSDWGRLKEAARMELGPEA